MSTVLRRCLIDVHTLAIRSGRFKLSPLHEFDLDDHIEIVDVRNCIEYYETTSEFVASIHVICMLSELLWIVERATSDASTPFEGRENRTHTGRRARELALRDFTLF
ncbi:hypothetical protein CYMTET_4104 [Cymbomonas tetramitiformis]|uniref:Uncharacterized protein n=1 Tax=Cymbomonas tetramitiformis TaxID=36881 RepID=A0AAE0C6J5_9CHLO|nr:hypothetical protein CYMTET_41729 [Cymbomonas tetramitiformis]KAK3273872.1 hypothetical protein CYMTET_17909 [Cymbomonas tetramitiformis]KAK3288420.1 hypothetical protein CYMTET_4104 [Cymbomonas tetramitiformis]